MAIDASYEQEIAVPKGNWNPQDPLGWARDFGRRSVAYEARLQSLIKLGPGDEGYFPVDDIRVPGVTIVRTVDQAEKVMEKLMNADPSIYHACDTEVMDLDLSSQGPVGNGYVTCVSIYSGPDFDYGEGPGTALWIDNLDDACGILQIFRPWFEDERFLKVWHNYGFDRHVLWNEGIDVKGFGGDTMHMARLQDTSRARAGGYSLEALTGDLLRRKKESMKTIFGVNRLRKDGSEGAIRDIPPVEVMQRDPCHRSKWIDYSTYDAQGTYMLREKLEELLKERQWLLSGETLWDYYKMHMRRFGEVLTDMERRGVRVDARDYLAATEKQARKDRDYHDRKFRQWAATKIGPDGLALNLASAKQLAIFLFGGYEDNEKEKVFKVAREEIPVEALEAYAARDEAAKAKGKTPEPAISLDKMKVAQLKALCKDQGLKISGKKSDLIERLETHFLSEPKVDPRKFAEVDEMDDDELREALIGRELPLHGTRKELEDRLKEDIGFTLGLVEDAAPAGRKDCLALSDILERAARKEGGALADFLQESKEQSLKIPKFVDVTVRGLGLKPEKLTAGGSPSVTAAVLRTLAGDPFADPPKYGTAYAKLGKEGCEALSSLCSIGSIDTMIANFLTSLQELADEDNRVHCSLNLNTETGRLSSRRPNLQNQPALEKDTYKIRKAFQSSPGNNLIVADYGQLELRLLASMTNCKSMIDAFEAGGDFHSRTALDMFPYIREKLDSGECLLEWDYNNGDPPKPLIKDIYGSERRKAKTLNFSIAYGKTAHGLSQDWGVDIKEAEEMLQAWYEARPEVRDWQADVKASAKAKGITRTLMGRYRDLPEAMGKNMRLVSGALRASINTPIQGGAADVAMMAMNKINDSEKLKHLGWILLLQIHDEVILEGPEETAEEAFEEVVQCMQEPWVYGLDKTAVPLLVDGSYTHKNWYEAK